MAKCHITSCNNTALRFVKWKGAGNTGMLCGYCSFHLNYLRGHYLPLGSKVVKK